MRSSALPRWLLLSVMTLGWVAPLGLASRSAEAAPPDAESAAPSPPAPAPAKAKAPKRGKDTSKPKPREAGSKPGKPDQTVRDLLTGDFPEHSTAAPSESEELKAMRELDREIFPPPGTSGQAPWATTVAVPSAGPAVSTSGLPATSPSTTTGTATDAKADLSWIAVLKKPDFPVRFAPSVVRYLRYYRDNPRGQRLVKAWMKKSGRYKDGIVKLLRHYKMPEDLVWVALIESGFNSDIHSHAGAAGLWQFMPATGRIYGLTVNRRVDERLDPERATDAALKHLQDLYKRFGTWELAFAAYNMGYGGLLASIRKFNTNDYWALRRLEAGLPYETSLYAPKIMAMAIVANNCKVFGCDGIARDAALPFGDGGGVDAVSVAPGVSIDTVAEAIGEKPERVAQLNPHVIGSRFPPLQQSTLPRTSWTVYVPKGKGKKAGEELPAKTAALNLDTHRVRWGETLPTLAAAFGTSTGWIEKLNDLHAHESPRPGTVVFVPSGRTSKSAAEIASGLGIVVTVPAQRFAFNDRRRVFFEPVLGDTLEDVARVTQVTPHELRRWNDLEARARLQEGMRLQIFIPKAAQPSGVILFEEPDVTVVTMGSQAFFDHHLTKRGQKRSIVTAAEGDTWQSLGARYGVRQGQLERINGRSRRSKIKAGQQIVIYTK